MLLLMTTKIRTRCECFPTSWYSARVRPLSRVGTLVGHKIRLAVKLLVTHGATVDLVSSVHAKVTTQVGVMRKDLGTPRKVAHVLPILIGLWTRSFSSRSPTILSCRGCLFSAPLGLLLPTFLLLPAPRSASILSFTILFILRPRAVLRAPVHVRI